jgi:hypothetical protein
MSFLDEYKSYLRIITKKRGNRVNLSELSFIDPMLITLLFNNIEKDDYIHPSNAGVDNYIKIMTQNYNNLNFYDKSYVPITSVAQNNDYIENIGNIILNRYNIKNSNLIKYILGELIENINEHSKAINNYILGQYYKSIGLEICIFDNGIGIPENFNNHGISFKTDCDSIKLAINGTSTKDGSERGNGLSSINSIITNNLNTEFIIISGKGIYHYLNDKRILYDLEDKYKLEGTFIGILFRYKEEIDNIDIYNYM